MVVFLHCGLQIQGILFRGIYYFLNIPPLGKGYRGWYVNVMYVHIHDALYSVYGVTSEGFDGSFFALLSGDIWLKYSASTKLKKMLMTNV